MIDDASGNAWFQQGDTILGIKFYHENFKSNQVSAYFQLTEIG